MLATTASQRSTAALAGTLYNIVVCWLSAASNQEMFTVSQPQQHTSGWIHGQLSQTGSHNHTLPDHHCYSGGLNWRLVTSCAATQPAENTKRKQWNYLCKPSSDYLIFYLKVVIREFVQIFSIFLK